MSIEKNWGGRTANWSEECPLQHPNCPKRAVSSRPDCRSQVPFHNLKPIILAAQEQLNFRVS